MEIPIRNPSEGTFYKVRSGREVSHLCSFQGYPDGGLRIAVVADTGFAVADWGKAVFLEKPHLLVSAGDHVPALHNGHPVPPGDTTAFLELVGRHPDLFQSTPWMPLLGNHDREVRPRGPNPPDEPVYDVEATAVRDFFALPGREWIWDFEIPAFGVRFVALDMRHLSD